MLDPFDYLEPECALCGGREFYNPQEGDALGSIPVDRVIEKIDQLYAKGNLNEASRLLNYWRQEGLALRDYRGLISINNELVGVYRKLNDEKSALNIVEETLSLIDRLNIGDTVSGATILLNCATDLKAFGQALRAIPMYNKVEEVYLAHLDNNDDMLAGLYNNCALAYVDVGQYQQAEEYYNKALAVKANVTGGELESAITYVNLAHLYEEWGKMDRVLECMETAEYLLKTDNITNNGYYAFVLEKCSPSFEYFGLTEQAQYFSLLSKELYERS